MPYSILKIKFDHHLELCILPKIKNTYPGNMNFITSKNEKGSKNFLKLKRNM